MYSCQMLYTIIHNLLVSAALMCKYLLWVAAVEASQVSSKFNVSGVVGATSAIVSATAKCVLSLLSNSFNDRKQVMS